MPALSRFVLARRDLIACCMRRSIGRQDTTLTTKGRFMGRQMGAEWRGLWTGCGYSTFCPIYSVRVEMLRVRPAGRVGGQANHTGSTSTFSPSVQSGAT